MHHLSTEPESPSSTLSIRQRRAQITVKNALDVFKWVANIFNHFPTIKKQYVHINCFGKGPSEQMMTQKVIPECLFVLVADEEGRRRRKIANWDGAHPSPVPPQGHSCNLVISLIIVCITSSSLLSASPSIFWALDKQKLEPHAARQGR